MIAGRAVNTRGSENASDAFRSGGLDPIRARPMINDLWYKNAVIYCLSVGTYMGCPGQARSRLVVANHPRGDIERQRIFPPVANLALPISPIGG